MTYKLKKKGTIDWALWWVEIGLNSVISPADKAVYKYL